MFVLEELDNKKKGMTEVARNARQASRFLDEIVSDAPHKIEEASRWNPPRTRTAPAACNLQTSFIKHELPQQSGTGQSG